MLTNGPTPCQMSRLVWIVLLTLMAKMTRTEVQTGQLAVPKESHHNIALRFDDNGLDVGE